MHFTYGKFGNGRILYSCLTDPVFIDSEFISNIHEALAVSILIHNLNHEMETLYPSVSATTRSFGPLWIYSIHSTSLTNTRNLIPFTDGRCEMLPGTSFLARTFRSTSQMLVARFAFVFWPVKQRIEHEVTWWWTEIPKSCGSLSLCKTTKYELNFPVSSSNRIRITALK